MMRADETIPTLFGARVDVSREAIALQEYDADRNALGRALSWLEWRERAYDLASAFVDAGCAHGRACAILAGNTLLWPVAELGAIHAGLVTVGIYPTSSAAQLRAMLADCSASAIVVDGDLQLAKVREATAEWTTPLLVVVRADVPLRCDASTDALGVREVSWDDFVARGAAVRRNDPPSFEIVRQRSGLLVPDDVAILMYTSGSTGEAKGARLSHRYVVESARSIRDTLALGRDDSSVSYLPFAHASERIFGLYTRIACGMTATLVSDPAHLWPASRLAKPTLFGGMPRFYEKVHEGLLAARNDASAAEARMWDATIACGRERARRRQRGEPVPPELEQRWENGRAPIVATLASFFGDKLRLATSGGAALPLEVAEYLDACGLTVLGAYGLTEHLCGTFNRPDFYRHDSVGVAMPGTMFRIGEEGEVQFWRSALTFSGYHQRPQDTTAAFTDDGAWLRTGDLGTVDADGFLRITGRLKELIALSNGKKVAPLPIEARLIDGEEGLISHAVVLGEGRPYLVALLTMRWTLVEQWQRRVGVDGDRATIVTHPLLREEVARCIERANREVSRPEQIKHFRILPHEFSVDGGDLTPSHKVLRNVVAGRYAAEIDTLYQEQA